MWEPKANIATLEARADIVHRIRNFFQRRGVMEVDVPALGEHSVTDPYLDALSLTLSGKQHFLQTSPEYFMKRLLCAGSGDIFYLGKAFRADEKGRNHRPEFSMLEWYRLGFGDADLIKDVFELVLSLKPETSTQCLSYREIFEQHLGLNPHTATLAQLRARALDITDVSFDSDNRSMWLDLLFTHVIEPNLPRGLVAVCDYPACQSALARLGENRFGEPVAKRFEVFFDGLELANGYWELSDFQEQKARFDADNNLRQTLGKESVIPDTAFLAAIESGLPDCAGVALGVDRLVMRLLGLADISEQLSF